MYRRALDSAVKYRFFRPKTPGGEDILFPGSLEARGNGQPALRTEVQHLGCFVGGMVGLGARIIDSPEELAMAIRLTDGCVWAYQNTASGVMPEIFHIDECPSEGSCEWTDEGHVELGHGYGFTKSRTRATSCAPRQLSPSLLCIVLRATRSGKRKAGKCSRPS
jgi:mannosyl-oligosaccharide alpha-1,2-mannosidase